MRSSFFGIETARRAIAAHRTTIDVIGHNLANANTEGYSKQDAVLNPTTPYFVQGARQLSLGTGVAVETITRRQSRYLDREIYRRTGELEMYDARRQIFSQVEDVLGEPGTGGLGGVLDRFWNAWQDLAGEADSPALRSSVIERAREMGDAFASVDRQLSSMMTNLEQTIGARVNRVNTIISELAEVSERIVSLTAAAAPPNDLLDRRDLLVEELSGLVNVDAGDADDGGIRLVVDGIPVLDSFTSRTLDVVAAGGGDHGRVSFTWSHNDSVIGWDPSAIGELGGLVGMRNEEIPEVLGRVSQLADGIREEANALHREGFALDGSPGGDFFVSIPGVLEVRQEILDSPGAIAAASTPDGVPGDGSNALLIGTLREVPGVGGATPRGFLRSLVADVGVRSEQARQMYVNNTTMLTQLLNQRDAITGVSIDEELTHLIQAQNAFNAAAKLVAVWDEMLSTIVNGLVR